MIFARAYFVNVHCSAFLTATFYPGHGVPTGRASGTENWMRFTDSLVFSDWPFDPSPRTPVNTAIPPCVLAPFPAVTATSNAIDWTGSPCLDVRGFTTAFLLVAYCWAVTTPSITCLMVSATKSRNSNGSLALMAAFNHNVPCAVKRAGFADGIRRAAPVSHPSIKNDSGAILSAGWTSREKRLLAQFIGAPPVVIWKPGLPPFGLHLSRRRRSGLTLHPLCSVAAVGRAIELPLLLAQLRHGFVGNQSGCQWLAWRQRLSILSTRAAYQSERETIMRYFSIWRPSDANVATDHVRRAATEFVARSALAFARTLARPRRSPVMQWWSIVSFRAGRDAAFVPSICHARNAPRFIASVSVKLLQSALNSALQTATEAGRANPQSGN